MTSTRPQDPETLPAEVPVIDFTGINLGRVIGTGGFGKVYHGHWQRNQVAVKELFLTSFTDNLRKDFENEAFILSKCRHPSIVHFFGICMEAEKRYLVMEYVSKGSLHQILDSTVELDWNPVRMLICQDIAFGLNYLHSQNIVHRDLKSMNILLDENFRAKITDFGLSKVRIASATLSKSKAASIRWNAPELLGEDGRETNKSDVWSLGMVLWEVASRKIPFADIANDMRVAVLIMGSSRPEIPKDCPQEVAAVIQACWKVDPKSRPNAAEVAYGLEKILKSMPEISFTPGQKEYQAAVKCRSNCELPQALKWALEAAAKGYPASYILLYAIYKDLANQQEADVWEQKIRGCSAWYERQASTSKDPLDKHNLAFCYFFGLGVPRETKKAYDLFLEAANAGNKISATNIAYFHEKGMIVPESKQKAFEWYNKANEIPHGQYCIGICYLDGVGVPVDNQKAVVWLNQAAEKGHVGAQAALAFFYERSGKQEDAKIAKQWFEKAAKQGYLIGESKLKASK